MAAPAVLDVHEAQLLANLLGPSPDGGPFRFIDIVAPVRAADDAVIGVLAAHLSLSWASDQRDELLAARNPELQERILILDRGGRVLLGDEVGSRPFENVHSGGNAVRVAANGEERLAVFSATRGRGEFPGLGWTVAVEQPTRVAMAPANRLTF